MAKGRKQIKNGSYLGPCKILRLLGRGSMGETYEAQDVLLDRHAVVKVVSPFIPEVKEVIKRFVAIGQSLAKINHQNIATIYNLKEIDSVHFIVMEFVEGRSLKDLIRDETRVSPALAIKVFCQALEGVHCLHEAGIKHQDLKPKNIIVRADSFVKVVDFGIGRVDGQEVVGTVYYLAPEVIDGAPGTIRSDIWSLGISMYECLTGDKPFLSEDWNEVVQKIADEPLTFPPHIEIPEALKNIILKMCEKNPEDRYSSLREIITELRTLESLGSIAVPPALEVSVKSISALSGSNKYVSPKATQASPAERKPLSPPNSLTETATEVPRADTFAMTTLVKPISKMNGVAKYIVAGTAICAGIWYYRKFDFSEKAVDASAKTMAVSAAAKESPSEGQVVVLPAGEVLKFTWSQPPRGGVYIEVARDREFRERVLREPYRTSPYSPNSALKEGKYFWRLIDQSNARNLVEPISFTVLSSAAPKPMYPSDSFVSADGKPTQFFWLNKFGVDTYRFQIASDKEFKQLVTDIIVEGIQTEPISLPEGHLFWRVRAEDHHSVTSTWSEPRQLQASHSANSAARKVATVSIPAPAPAPQPAPTLAPTPEPTARPKAAANSIKEKPKTAAPVVKTAKVAKEEKFSLKLQTVSKTKSSKASFGLLAEKPKKDKKAKALSNKKSADGFEIIPAPAVKRRVASDSGQGPGPQLKMPPDGVSIVSLNGNQDPVSFRWGALAQSTVYRLQLASDSGFKNIVLNAISTENQFVVTKKLPEGRIFWRVRSEESSRSEWSATSSFDVSK